MWCAAGGTQPQGIALHLRPFSQMLQRFTKNTRRDCVSRNREPIMHPLAVASCSHNACLAEIGQVTRDLRLARAQDFHEITNTNFAIGDEVQQPKPRGIGERAKQKVERETSLQFWHAQSIHHIRLDVYVSAGVVFKYICSADMISEASMAGSDIREVVKSKYGEAARRVKAGKQAGCGGG